MQEKKIMKVAAIGELLIDLAQTGLSDDGYPYLAANPGGAPANFLAALCGYGCEGVFIGKVGNDAFGDLLEKTLEDKGICTAGLVKTDVFFTTLAFVTFDKNGERTFSFARKPGADAALTFEEIDTALIESSDVLHFGTVSLTREPAAGAVKKAVLWAKERGRLISFDPNYREPLWDERENAKEAILWGLKAADVVKISDNEVEFLWQADPQEGADRILNEFGAKLVFVTLGPEGCFFCNKNVSGTVTAPKVRPKDTTGAGDIFGGSALSRLLRLGKDPALLTYDELKDIADFACTAASLSTERSGGIGSVPPQDEVMALMSRQHL